MPKSICSGKLKLPPLCPILVYHYNFSPSRALYSEGKIVGVFAVQFCMLDSEEQGAFSVEMLSSIFFIRIRCFILYKIKPEK